MSPVDELAELIDYVARALVDEPDDVSVEAVEGDRAIILELSVAPEDLGKVIGKDGRTARAMRTLLSATSARMRRRAILDILE
ncbi:MAG: KH domain-containing protein [Sandaracinaceae bacterium]|nr:KH domain-containing protein [Sandaracinaceae bacterium]